MQYGQRASRRSGAGTTRTHTRLRLLPILPYHRTSSSRAAGPTVLTKPVTNKLLLRGDKRNAFSNAGMSDIHHLGLSHGVQHALLSTRHITGLKLRSCPAFDAGMNSVAPGCPSPYLWRTVCSPTHASRILCCLYVALPPHLLLTWVLPLLGMVS